MPIGLWEICQQDAEKPVPGPSSLTPCHAADEILTLVDIDFAAYRRANDLRTVRKNAIIQSWLNDLAEQQGVNFSQVLSDGLKQRLGMQDR